MNATTVGDRLTRVGESLLLAAGACNPNLDRTATPDEIRTAIERILLDAREDLYWAIKALDAHALRTSALTADERVEAKEDRAREREWRREEREEEREFSALRRRRKAGRRAEAKPTGGDAESPRVGGGQ